MLRLLMLGPVAPCLAGELTNPALVGEHVVDLLATQDSLLEQDLAEALRGLVGALILDGASQQVTTDIVLVESNLAEQLIVAVLVHPSVL